jgi:predicted lipid carrier protein YhbT
MAETVQPLARTPTALANEERQSALQQTCTDALAKEKLALTKKRYGPKAHSQE